MLTGGAKAANRVSHGRIPAKTFCFVAGTLVLTAQGLVPIEAVSAGEMVLSRDSATGEQGLREVTELYTATRPPSSSTSISETRRSAPRPHTPSGCKA